MKLKQNKTVGRPSKYNFESLNNIGDSKSYLHKKGYKDRNVREAAHKFAGSQTDSTQFVSRGIYDIGKKRVGTKIMRIA